MDVFHLIGLKNLVGHLYVLVVDRLRLGQHYAEVVADADQLADDLLLVDVFLGRGVVGLNSL